jgi:hypothetical protein
MRYKQLAVITMTALFPVSVYAANPFLDAPDNKPVSASFHGREWNDDFQEQDIPHEIPLTARVVTTRIVKMPWGAIFKIEFTDLKSRAPEKREIPPPRYFIVTDDRIVLLNEEDNDDDATKMSELEWPPEFEANDVYGITSGSFEHEEGLWKTAIKLKGELCTYKASHPSGHFTEVIWKKGVGLVEYAQNYGAGREGFRLKRTTTSQKR